MKKATSLFFVLAAGIAHASADETVAMISPTPATSGVQPVTPTPPTLMSAPTKKTSVPHMELLSPVKRKDVDINRLGMHPCGGTKVGRVHYETTPGSRNLVGWKILQADPNGRCMIRLSDSPLEKDMFVVKPLDGSAADDGSFPCGREISSFEAKEFKIPRDFVCDNCLMQLVWMTEDGDQYRCTDFESVSAEVPECFGQCMNGGICRNGRCACPAGYSGSNCQYEDETAAPSFMQVLLDDSVVLIVYAIMIALIVGLLIGAYILAKRAMERRNASVVVEDDSDKLTSANQGRVKESRFAEFDQDKDDK